MRSKAPSGSGKYSGETISNRNLRITPCDHAEGIDSENAPRTKGAVFRQGRVEKATSPSPMTRSADRSLSRDFALLFAADPRFPTALTDHSRHDIASTVTCKKMETDRSM
ncbi:hypothetical protein ACRAWD_18695 [Caulobacter segnis]